MKLRSRVLLVEGNEARESLTHAAILDSGAECDVLVARDGLEASRILFESVEPTPTLILLELDIPKMDGFSVLARIRNSPRTSRIPVVVFSASGTQDEIDRSFDLHANTYAFRDEDIEYFNTRLKLILYYWIAVNRTVAS